MPDPLPINEVTYNCTTVAQVLQVFDQSFGSPLSGESIYLLDVTTTLVNGYRGWRFEVDTGFSIEIKNVVCVNSSGEVAYMLYAGIQGFEYRSISTTNVHLPSEPDWTWENFATWMSGPYLEKKVEILEWLTDSPFTVLDILQLYNEAASVGTVNVTMQVDDGTTAYTITDTYGWSRTPDAGEAASVLYITGTTSAAAPGQVQQKDERMIEALEDIATIDSSIDFNHGDSVVSIRGRAKTGV